MAYAHHFFTASAVADKHFRAEFIAVADFHRQVNKDTGRRHAAAVVLTAACLFCKGKRLAVIVNLLTAEAEIEGCRFPEAKTQPELLVAVTVLAVGKDYIAAFVVLGF